MPRKPPPSYAMKLSARIKSIREKQGLTQAEAARKAGIDYKRWHEYENGHEPTAERLFQIADALGVKTDELRV